MKKIKEGNIEKIEARGAGRRELVISLAVIVFLAIVVYGYLCQPGKTLYSAHSDFVVEHQSTKQVLYDSIRQGRGIPFWRSDQFSGYAGIINPQSQFTFPLHFLFFFSPPLAAVGGTFFLYFLSAGIVYYILARVLGLGFWPRLLMAAGGMFSFKLIIGAYAGWLPNLPIVICFPLLFAAVFHTVKKPSLGSALATAAAGGLCLHCGHLQLLYYSFWFLLAYLLIYLVIQLRAGQWQPLPRLGMWLILAGVLAVGLAAYLIWPLAAEANLVSRSQTSYEFFIGAHSISIQHLATFFYPEALGTPLDHSYQTGLPGGDELWEDVGYFGLIPLILAGVGAILGWRRKPTKYLAICFIVTVFLAIDSPVLKMLYDYLPGFKIFRIPSRFLFLTTFFGIALAGIGLEEAIRRLTVKFPMKKIAAASVILIALMTFEGAVYAQRYLTMAPYNKSLPQTDYHRYLEKDASLYRIATFERQTFNYGWAAPMNLQIVTGMDSFNYRQYLVYFELMRWNRPMRTVAVWYDIDRRNLVRGILGPKLIVRYDMLDALNVKYMLSFVQLEFPDDQYELVETFRSQPVYVLYLGLDKTDIFLYRNKRFMPRTFWAQRVIQAADANEVISLMQANDMRNVAVVEGQAPASPPPDPADSAEVSEIWAGHLVIKTDSKNGGLLIVSEVWHPGWKAALDGERLPLYRVDYSLMGAAMPPGRHELVMDFRPINWRKAFWTSVISAVFLAAGTFCVLARRIIAAKKRKTATPTTD